MLLTLDNTLLDLIARLRCGFLDRAMPLISALCNHGEIWLLIACALLMSKRRRRAGAAVFLAVAMGFVAGSVILKPLIGRVRPFSANGMTDLLIAAPRDASFPSGHTLSSFAASVALLLYDRRLGVTALVLAVLIAFSRLYLYVHYPSDVLGGAVIGCLCGISAVWVTTKGGALPLHPA